jgi:homoserine O-acetyltransferase
MRIYTFYMYLYAHVPNFPKNKFQIIPITSMCATSSPSNTPEPMNAAQFPKVTLYDNVTLQHRSVII